MNAKTATVGKGKWTYQTAERQLEPAMEYLVRAEIIRKR
jgi:hypothetical protein